MNSTIELAHGPFALQIEPAVGGCIAGFSMEGIAVLRPMQPPTPLQTAVERVRLSASYPLVPYSNRIGHGHFQWQGQAFELAQNFLPEVHAIHGIGWQRPWQVVECTDSTARLVLRHQPELPSDYAAWPFAFDCLQTFALDDDGLQMELALTNGESSRAMPAGLGFHPYFAQRPGSRIAFAAAGRWQMDALNLPSERLPSPGLDTDCASLDVDHCFEGCASGVQLTDAQLDIHITSDQPRLVVYTRPGKDFIAIEPVSHVNNALGRAGSSRIAHDLGVKILQPGETFKMQMRIDVRRPRNTTKESV